VVVVDDDDDGNGGEEGGEGEGVLFPFFYYCCLLLSMIGNVEEKKVPFLPVTAVKTELQCVPRRQPMLEFTNDHVDHLQGQ